MALKMEPGELPPSPTSPRPPTVKIETRSSPLPDNFNPQTEADYVKMMENAAIKRAAGTGPRAEGRGEWLSRANGETTRDDIIWQDQRQTAAGEQSKFRDPIRKWVECTESKQHVPSFDYSSIDPDPELRLTPSTALYMHQLHQFDKLEQQKTDKRYPRRLHGQGHR